MMQLTYPGLGRARALWRLGLTGATVAALSGCGSLKGDTAWEVMESQRQQQTLVQQYEAEQSRKNVASQPEILLSMIREMQSQRRYFASLAHIDAYIQRFGSEGDIQALRANALRMTGQVAESRQAYQALTKTPYAAQGWHGLGLLAGQDGNFEEARTYLERAVKLAPTQADMLNDLAYALLRSGQVSQARLPLGKALELDPGNRVIVGNLALLLMLQGDALGAARVMEEAKLTQSARNQVHQLARDVQLRMVSQAQAMTQTAQPPIGATQASVGATQASSGVVHPPVAPVIRSAVDEASRMTVGRGRLTDLLLQ